MASMRQIGVVYNSTPQGMFWETITQFFENLPNIEMYRFGSEQELEEVLRPDGPQILGVPNYSKLLLFEYIEIFYNRRRRHSYLGNTSPAEYEARYAS
jgi:transposase InsO family protein